jgi:hypothetical protein
LVRRWVHDEKDQKRKQWMDQVQNGLRKYRAYEPDQKQKELGKPKGVGGRELLRTSEK